MSNNSLSPDNSTNSTKNCVDDAEEWKTAYHRMLTIVPFIIIVVGTFGNTIAYFVLSQKSYKRNVMAGALRYLAIIDNIMIWTVTSEVFVRGAFSVDLPSMSIETCVIYYYYVNIIASLDAWTLVFITATRLVHIACPFKVKTICSRFNYYVMFFLQNVFIVSIFCTIMVTIYTDLPPETKISMKMTCYFVISTAEAKQTILMFVKAGVNFILPCVLLITINAFTLFELRKVKLRNRKLHSTHTTSSIQLSKAHTSTNDTTETEHSALPILDFTQNAFMTATHHTAQSTESITRNASLKTNKPVQYTFMNYFIRRKNSSLQNEDFSNTLNAESNPSEDTHGDTRMGYNRHEGSEKEAKTIYNTNWNAFYWPFFSSNDDKASESHSEAMKKNQRTDAISGVKKLASNSSLALWKQQISTMRSKPVEMFQVGISGDDRAENDAKSYPRSTSIDPARQEGLSGDKPHRPTMMARQGGDGMKKRTSMAGGALKTDARINSLTRLLMASSLMYLSLNVPFVIYHFFYSHAISKHTKGCYLRKMIPYGAFLVQNFTYCLNFYFYCATGTRFRRELALWARRVFCRGGKNRSRNICNKSPFRLCKRKKEFSFN